MGRIQAFDVQNGYKLGFWDIVLVGAVIAFFVI